MSISDDDLSAAFCQGCGKETEDLYVCSRCKVAAYCSRACQAHCWKNGHKQSCILAKVEPKPSLQDPGLVRVRYGEAKYGFLYTTAMTKKKLPDLLAVDAEIGAFQQVEGCLLKVVEDMVVNGFAPPHLHRYNLWHPEGDKSKAGSIVYFAIVRVTDPYKLKKLYRDYMVRAPRANEILLLMPIVKRQGAACWGHLPPAPEDNTAMRNAIKCKWEMMPKTIRGERFVRFLDGDANNASASNKVPVKLAESLDNPEWEVNWKYDLTREECDYVIRNIDHFKTLFMDGVDPDYAEKYVSKVCNNGGEKLHRLQMKNVKIEDLL